METPAPEKIKAYLNEELPRKEREAIRQWIAVNRDHPLLTAALKEHWNRIPEHMQPAESQSAFRNFERSVGGFPHPSGKPAFRVFFGRIRNIAAILTIPLLICSIFLWSRSSAPDPDYLEFAVTNGRQDSVRLPDNTMVWLNSGSKIIYPMKFGRRSRQVFISGEAFFDVEKDRKRPFILKANDISIKVLGTKFNFNSYEDANAVTVSLLEGSVLLYTDRAQKEGSVALCPGDVVRYDRTSGDIERTHISTDAYCSWRNGGFYFNNQSLSEIAAQFERVFDVKIVVLGKKLQEARYTLAFVNGESLGQMLSAINYNGSMQIVKDEETGVITIK